MSRSILPLILFAAIILTVSMTPGKGYAHAILDEPTVAPISNVIEGNSTVLGPEITATPLPEQVYINETYRGWVNITLGGGMLTDVSIVLRFTSENIPFEDDDVIVMYNIDGTDVNAICTVSGNHLTCIYEYGLLTPPGENISYAITLRDVDWLNKDFTYEFFLTIT